MKIFIVRRSYGDEGYEDLEFLDAKNEAERWARAYVSQKSSVYEPNAIVKGM